MEIKEKFLMFTCHTCKTARDVWYDTHGDTCDEDVYRCLKCGYYFFISAVCDECGSPHSRSYGCNNRNCKCEEYHYDHEEEEVEREVL